MSFVLKKSVENYFKSHRRYVYKTEELRNFLVIKNSNNLPKFV